MVWNRIRDAFSGPPTLDGPSKVPDYFPVEPRGCEKHAQRLFECIGKDATEKARDMEKAGYGKSYYPDDVEAERTLKNKKEDEKQGGAAASATAAGKNNVVVDDASQLPVSINDNPLDECRTLIAYYKRCCDRELKKKKNWILTGKYYIS